MGVISGKFGVYIFPGAHVGKIIEFFTKPCSTCVLDRGFFGWAKQARFTEVWSPGSLLQNLHIPMSKYTPGSSNIAVAGKWTPIEDVFPIKHGDIPLLCGGFKHVLFSPLPWEMIQFDEHIFQMGWFNHQLDCYVSLPEGMSK